MDSRSPRREDDDDAGVLLDSPGNGGHREGLRGIGRTWSKLTDLVEKWGIANGGLGEERRLGHHLD